MGVGVLIGRMDGTTQEKTAGLIKTKKKFKGRKTANLSLTPGSMPNGPKSTPFVA